MDNLNKVIIHAARLGETDVLRELIARKMDINARMKKDIHRLSSCYNNQYETAKLLLEAVRI